MALDKHLVDERARYFLAIDSAYPEVGFPLMISTARKKAIESLKLENKIDKDYKE